MQHGPISGQDREAAAARATLISESNWEIRDDGRDPQCE